MSVESADPAASGRSNIAAALLAAGLFVVADWWAAGSQDLPADLILLSFVVFAAVATVCAVFCHWLGVSRFAVPLFLVLVHSLQWLAMWSKELGELPSMGRALLAVVAALLTLLFGWLTGRSRSVWWPSAAAIPCSYWFAVLGTAPSWWFLATVAVPVVVAGLGLTGRRAGPVAYPLTLLILAAHFVRGTPTSNGGTQDPTARTAADSAPCILLVSIDTFRYDAAFAGSLSPGTPVLSKLAQEGVTFTQAMSPAPWTLPAHASLFTSLYPGQHGAVVPTSRLADEFLTLPEVLSASGYETAAFTGGGFLIPATGLAQGFAEFDGAAEFRLPPLTRHIPLLYRVVRNRSLPITPLLPLMEHSGGLAQVNERVRQWLQQRDRARPYFVFAHTYEIHDYYVYQPSMDDHGPLATRFAGQFQGRLWVHPDEILASADTEETRAFLAIYRNRIANIDRRLGELIATARAAAGPRDLWIIVTSDHGEGFETDPRRLVHGGRLHDDLLHVPLVFHGAAFPTGRQIHEVVSLVDVMPTLLELLGQTPLQESSGRSLTALWSDGPFPAKPVFGEHGPGDQRSVALRTHGWKLILNTRGREAYDLGEDPKEHRNQAESGPAKLWHQLQEWQKKWQPKAENADFDSAALEHLRQLGYIE